MNCVHCKSYKVPRNQKIYCFFCFVFSAGESSGDFGSGDALLSDDEDGDVVNDEEEMGDDDDEYEQVDDEYGYLS